MNGEDLANKAGLNKTNRFIFSDSYYEKMPEVPGRPTFDPIAPPKKKEDISQEVKSAENALLSQANYSNADSRNSFLNRTFSPDMGVQQASSLEQVVQNDYSNGASSTDSFDFFTHQANTVVSDSNSNDFSLNNASVSDSGVNNSSSNGFNLNDTSSNNFSSNGFNLNDTGSNNFSSNGFNLNDTSSNNFSSNGFNLNDTSLNNSSSNEFNLNDTGMSGSSFNGVTDTSSNADSGSEDFSYQPLDIPMQKENFFDTFVGQRRESNATNADFSQSINQESDQTASSDLHIPDFVDSNANSSDTSTSNSFGETDFDKNFSTSSNFNNATGNDSSPSTESMKFPMSSVSDGTADGVDQFMNRDSKEEIDFSKNAGLMDSFSNSRADGSSISSLGTFHSSTLPDNVNDNDNVLSANGRIDKSEDHSSIDSMNHDFHNVGQVPDRSIEQNSLPETSFQSTNFSQAAADLTTQDISSSSSDSSVVSPNQSVDISHFSSEKETGSSPSLDSIYPNSHPLSDTFNGGFDLNQYSDPSYVPLNKDEDKSGNSSSDSKVLSSSTSDRVDLKESQNDQFDVFDIRRDSKGLDKSLEIVQPSISDRNLDTFQSAVDPSSPDYVDFSRPVESKKDTQSSSDNNYIFGVSGNPFADIEKEKVSIFSGESSSLASVEKELAKGDETVDFIQKLKDQDSQIEDKSTSESVSRDSTFGIPVQEKKDFLWEPKKETPIEEIKVPERKLEYDSHFGVSSSPKERKFIVNGDPSIEVDSSPRKSDSTKIPDFMSGTIRTNDLNIETGINKELEAELLRQRNEEEAQRLLENSEYLAYQELTARKPKQKMVYKAGGKSYIRDIDEKKKLSSAKELASQEAAMVQSEEEVAVEEDIPIEKKEPKSIEELIEGIVGVPDLANLEVKLNPFENPGVKFGFKEKEDKKVVVEDQPTTVYDEKKDNFDYDQNFDNVEVVKSTLLDELVEKSQKEGRISVLARYGEDFCARDYITNPAIGRANEIKQLILILLTPEKSGILIGKPGIGKTSIVEGLSYQLQRNNVPDALKGYRIVSVKTTSLLGSLPTGETRLQTLIDELKELDKIILFIDEIHMLVGATSESALDFANMFKESLGRGSIKVIGATTTEEYERYILRDKAFVRRFQKVEVEEPNREQTIKILLGTLPKIEKVTGAKLKYTQFMQSEIMSFIVDITTEYKRVYGIGSRYPDICLTLLSQAFSQAVFANRQEVNIHDIRKAIENSKNIYPDVIRKELVNFDHKFRDLIRDEEMNQ